MLAVLVAACLGLGLSSGCGDEANSAAAQAAVDPATPVQHFRFFVPSSFWNTPVPADAPIDPDSAPTVALLGEKVKQEQKEEVGPWINTTSYNVPIYKVPRDQPVIQIHLTSPYAETDLRRAWRAVPLPPNAQPAAGNDAHLVVWQPATDQLWEFWHLRHDASGWEADWGGAIDGVSSDPGAYSSGAWPGATPFWGASASSLSIAGGLITLEDLNRGWINHALAMSVPNVRANVYASPAQRTDGKSTNPASLPEGAHLRLSPKLDLASLHLPHMTLLLAQAAQRFGIFIRDGAKTVAFYAQEPKSAFDPYAGPNGYFKGLSAREVLAPFPWDDLELLQMNLHAFSNYQHGPA